MLASFPKVPKTKSPENQRFRISITPLSFDAPSPENPCEYPHKLYIARNYSQWPTFLPLIVWVYLHSIFLWWAPKYASFLKQNAYRPFKIIQGR